jgi:hypothetical protein
MRRQDVEYIKTGLFLMVVTVGVSFLTSCGSRNGTNGRDGKDGLPGSNGGCTTSVVLPGPAAPNGGTTISCSDGSTALLLNGTNGIDGTLITPVQFCPGTGHYPNVFPEVGFIIGGRMYAVYSDKGGFLFEVLPGNYHSNAIGNSCNFTLNSDLTVTR